MKTDPRTTIQTTLDRLLANRFAPVSTYRLQLHKDFTFANATVITSYLKDLGISTAYASPYLTATPGSTHGYDVIDHQHLNPELKPDAFEGWINALNAAGMTHIVDIVPNHMGIESNVNAWWNDVLENGPEAEHGKYFDIAWHGSPRKSLQGKVLLPVFGPSYAEALEKGELKLVRDAGKLFVTYYDRRFPLSPKSITSIFGATLPSPEAIDAQLAKLNTSPNELDAVLDQQYYRLASWRTASDEINYRRFFDVGSLAAIAMERPEVFEQAHTLIMKLLVSGKLQGLRLDHPDGLYDPGAYFDRLQNEFVIAMAMADLKTTDLAIAASLRSELNAETALKKPLYVLGEKILAMSEPLPTEWPVDGTTGYDFLIQVNAFFVDTANESAFTKIYQDFTGEMQDVEELCRDCKLLILDRAMSSELHMLTNQLDELSQQHRASRDFTFGGLRSALRELIASFSVYRTYITDALITDRDRTEVTKAVAKAKKNAPEIDQSLFDYVQSILLRSGDADDETRRQQIRFAGKFQQLTSPVTAKGIEDTAFYRYHRLTSLNEVGGEPARFGIEADDLHAYLAERQKHWPLALSTLSTHDTKRSEDVRARINVLSEIPETWAKHVDQWRSALAPLKLTIHANDEYMLYQTLVGAWPITPEADLAERLHGYMTKALREAKLRTTWTAPNEAYEKTVHDLIDAIFDSERTPAFHATFAPFQQRISQAGHINSLAQTVLKFFAPGVPDTYQGTELWNYSLVDPDNRRPVDYARRQSLLKQIEVPFDSDDLKASLEDGRAKLRVTHRSLQVRQANPKLFHHGEYVPLKVVGEHARHALAFARELEGDFLIAVVPRLLEHLRDAGVYDLGKTAIEIPKRWIGRSVKNIFTDQTFVLTGSLNASKVLRDFPVAALS